MRLSAAFLLASLIIARADDNAAGRWEGVAQIPGRELKLIVDLAQEGGAWHGAIIIPGMRIKGAPLAEVAVDSVRLSFSIKNALSAPRIEGPKVEAHFTADGTLTGDFTHAGNRAPIILRKIGPPQLEPPPRSTAVAREVEGEWRGEYVLFDYPRKVTLKLANQGDKGATAEFVIVGRKVNNLPVDLITQNGDFLTVDSHQTGMTFEGRTSGDTINGTVIQGPLEIPVVLKRSK